MILAALLAATLTGVFPPGSESSPGVIAPIVPTGDPVRFWWNETAFHVGDRVYPWAELGVSPKDGAKFKIDLGKFGRETVILEGELDSNSASFEIGSFGPIAESDVKTKMKVFPSKDGTYLCYFTAAGHTPDYLSYCKNMVAKKGAPFEVEFTGRGSPQGDAWCRITDPDNRILYHSSCEYRVPGMVLDYRHVWTEEDRKLMHVVVGNWTGEVPETHSMRVSAYDLKDDKIAAGWSKSVKLNHVCGEEDYAFDVSDLKEGFYWMRVEDVDAGGRVLKTDRFRYFKPGEHAPWEGTQLGNDDTVPPPWTKPVFAEDGTFSCWNRVFRLGGKGLVTSILNGGSELLQNPVAMLLDGRELTFDVKLVRKMNSEATYRLKARESDVTVLAVCEFDGYIKFRVRYGKGVKSLAWRASVARRHVVCFDDGHSDDEKDIIGAEGALDRTIDLAKSPWWWAGGAKGLCGGMLSLKGTHIHNLEKGGHVTADAASMTVTMNLVDEPYEGDGARMVDFYLEPTPMKPKNIEFDSLPWGNVIGWTGHLCEHFEAKYPGSEKPELFRKYRDEVKAGKRVFFYNATHGYSPDDPLWGWYGRKWMRDVSPGNYAHEIPIFDYQKTRKGRWQYTCMNDTGYMEAKIWGVNWYLHEPAPEMKDLYFDLANPAECPNPYHGCVWKDDFGREIHERSLARDREFHKRVYRILKAKNPDGLMYGHLTKVRKPSDAFFDYLSMGEFLAWKVHWQDSYYDIFTPEFMQSVFVPRSVDGTVEIQAQFVRWRGCWAPDLKYDPNEPEMDRAIRHFTAYAKIHGLKIEPLVFGGAEGMQYHHVESAFSVLGKGRRYWSYYDEGDAPVSLSRPGARQLWSYATGDGGSILVVLNDTDKPIRQVVSVKGLSGKGREVLDKTEFDFSSGKCTIDLGPRGAKFIVFRRK